ncbi:4192_t:CDS:2 [Gigaspora margarita]|uniref:4192_t:CDS:1 n=1 Tax=Gigaspora margarita TaxID=4874 RepID=A0ABN7UMX3_GIGMA|nr:4192_t:CDS:2 [Gigaspora margarita]
MQNEIPLNEQNTKDFSLLSPTYKTKNSEHTLDDSLQKDNTFNTDNFQSYTGEKEQNQDFGFVQYVLDQDAEWVLKELKKLNFEGKEL